MSDWPHAPLHRFAPEGFYFVSASTYGKRHHLASRARLNLFRALLFDLAAQYGCMLQAWALMSNHYHLVLYAREQLRSMLRELHRQSAIELNRMDEAEGRQVWYQYRDTQLTFEKSWLARLRYTMENPVHHRLVTNASDYPWCSAAWFERNSSRAFAESLRRFKIDRVNVPDAFEPVMPE